MRLLLSRFFACFIGLAVLVLAIIFAWLQNQ